jgi:hypothetical protein
MRKIIAMVQNRMIKTVHKNIRLRRKNDSIPTRGAHPALIGAAGICICICLKLLTEKSMLWRTPTQADNVSRHTRAKRGAGLSFSGDGRESSIGYLKMQLQNVYRSNYYLLSFTTFSARPALFAHAPS